MTTENKPYAWLAPTQWKPGQSGNPKGRKKGTRHRLAEDFVRDLYADWQENGASAIKDVREAKPHEYLRIVAKIVPKELNVKVNELDALSDDELAAELSGLLARLASANGGGGAGAGAEDAPQLPCDLSALQ